MTEIPEAPLARELGLPLLGLGMVTDYDAWRVGEVPVTQDEINSVSLFSFISFLVFYLFFACLSRDLYLIVTYSQRLEGNRDNMVKLLTALIPRIVLKDGVWKRCNPGEGAMLSA